MLHRIFLFFCFVVVASYSEPFYRRDYIYIPKFDAFYKLHWPADTALSWSSAFTACEDEGATLFYPKMVEEWTIVNELIPRMKNNSELNLKEVFVGMHYAVDLGEFITVDGNGVLNPGSIRYENDLSPKDRLGTCVTMNIHSGAYNLQSCSKYTDNTHIFICKKKVVVEACPTVDTDYVYVKEVGKCFKLHEVKQKTWQKAMETCFTEGGNLAIIKNSVEAEIIKKKMTLDNTDYFVGFTIMQSETSDRNFYTIHGDKFDNNFYIRWNHNVTYDTKDDCGVVFKFQGNLSTMTKDCDEPAPFLCEMLPRSYSWSAFRSPLLPVSDKNVDKDSVVFVHNWR